MLYDIQNRLRHIWQTRNPKKLRVCRNVTSLSVNDKKGYEFEVKKTRYISILTLQIRNQGPLKRKT